MDKFPKLFNEVFDFCKLYGQPYFTGSRAMGLETKESDWDIVMEVSNESIEFISERIQGVFGAKLLNYFDVNVMSNDRHILEIQNTTLFGWWVIPPTIHVVLENAECCNIERWKLATEYCKANKEAARDKKERVKIFTFFGVPQGADGKIYEEI